MKDIITIIILILLFFIETTAQGVISFTPIEDVETETEGIYPGYFSGE